MNDNVKYQDVYQKLREDIISGEIKPGERLPSENRLSEQYGMNRRTVRKAIGMLQEEGLVYAVQGKGTFCSDMMLHKVRSKNIAVITTYLTDYIFPRVIQGIDEVLTENGYSILLKSTRNARTMEERYLRELLGKNIDGLIIEPSKSHIFCRHLEVFRLFDFYRIPYVFIQGKYTQLPEKPYVLLNDQKGGYLATKHLLNLGHRDIVGIFKADDIQGQERHKGYVQALQEAGVLYDPDKVIWFYTEDKKTHPYEGLRDLLKKKNFTGIVAYNDQIAYQMIDALEKEGKRCPEDISVTGFDDSILSQTGKVKMTTIRHPQEKLGIKAAEILLDMIEHPDKETDRGCCQILMEPELVERESTCECSTGYCPAVFQ